MPAARGRGSGGLQRGERSCRRVCSRGRIRFGDIGAAIAGALDALGGEPGDSAEAILAADQRRARNVRGTVRMLAILLPDSRFGLVIFVHELGHFLAAKAVGVYAPRFSIGFGPALLKFRRGETEYILALLPLGGYRAHGVAPRRRDRVSRGRQRRTVDAEGK
jgi:hypothetical protein